MYVDCSYYGAKVEHAYARYNFYFCFALVLENNIKMHATHVVVYLSSSSLLEQEFGILQSTDRSVGRLRGGGGNEKIISVISQVVSNR